MRSENSNPKFSGYNPTPVFWKTYARWDLNVFPSPISIYLMELANAQENYIVPVS